MVEANVGEVLMTLRLMLGLPISFILTGCTIGHQQMQPDPNMGVSVTCLATEDEEACHAQARRRCPKGYMVDSVTTNAGRKNIAFHCDSRTPRNH